MALLVDAGLTAESAEVAGQAGFQSQTQEFALLDGPTLTAALAPDLDDNRIRRVYTFTTELNNSFF